MSFFKICLKSKIKKPNQVFKNAQKIKNKNKI